MRPLLERRARRPVGRTPRRVATFLTLTLSAAAPSVARALEPEITAETSAQFYDVRSPTGETIVPRRRLTSTLGVAAYDLMGARPWIVPDAAARGQGELLFRARLRYDADYLDAASFLAPFTCAAPDNFSGFCDPAYDAAFAAFTQIPPGPARDHAAAELDRHLGDAVPVRPVDQPEAWYIVQPWLQPVTRHPLAGLRIELLCPRTRPPAVP